MAEETKTTNKMENTNEVKKEEKIKEEQKIENNTSEEKKEVEETKKTEKQKDSKNANKGVKREFALVNGIDIGMSPKESGHICDMIRGKNVDEAIKMIEEVIDFKRPVKMTSREYPHQHGKGIGGACYPIEAAKHFLRLLKSLKANALHHELELEKVVIAGKADKASRPFRRGGSRFKRTHVMLKLIKKQSVKAAEKNKKETKDKSKTKGERK